MYRERIQRKSSRIGFKDCVLLRRTITESGGLSYLPKFTKVDTIHVYSTGMISCKGVEGNADFLIKSQNQGLVDLEYVFSVFRHLVTETYEYIINSIEDFYGCVYEDIDHELIDWLCDTYYTRKSSALKISRQFKESITNPKYSMCRNRLLKEFQDLNK